MADTRRTKSALLALLADNTTGNISEQDLRDVLVSLFGGYAEIYCTGAVTAQTGISAATPIKVTGFAANGPANGCTADQANDKLVIDVAGDYLVQFAAQCVGTANKGFELAVTIGTTKSHIKAYVLLPAAGATEFRCWAGGGILTLADGDEVSLYVTGSDASAVSLTPKHMQLCVRQIG